MFRQMDLKGKSRDDTQLKTVHQNTISTVRSYAEGGDGVRQFSSKSAFLKGVVAVTRKLTLLQRAVLMGESSSGRCKKCLGSRESYAATR